MGVFTLANHLGNDGENTMNKSHTSCITIRRDASKRTKQRVKMHGPEFVINRQGKPECMFGERSILVTSVDSGWFGWLPMSEVIISEIV